MAKPPSQLVFVSSIAISQHDRIPVFGPVVSTITTTWVYPRAYGADVPAGVSDRVITGAGLALVLWEPEVVVRFLRVALVGVDPFLERNGVEGRADGAYLLAGEFRCLGDELLKQGMGIFYDDDGYFQRDPR